MLLTFPAEIAAQPVATPPAPASAPATETEVVTFSADSVTYDSDADVVTASGAVRMSRDGDYLAADQVIWDRKSGQVYAKGSVVLLTPEGDKLVGDTVQLTDTLRDGTVDNLLVVLEGGGRIAASHGSRVNGISTFTNAIYSPCPVTNDSGCPKRPSWSITAARVIDDPKTQRVRFQGGRLQLFGIDLSSPTAIYVVALGFTLVLGLATKNLVRGHVGRQWMAIRDMDIAAEIIGVRPMYAKLTAFAVSSFLIGVAGAMWAFLYLGSWEPAAFSIDRSFQLMFMVIIGGLGSILGSVLGAIFIVLLPIFLNQALPPLGELVGWKISTATVSHFESMIFGALIVFFLVVEPHGLARLWSIAKEKLRLWPFPH